jgi:putative endonuclease
MTSNLEQRIEYHNSPDNVGSYTSNRKPVKLLWNIQLTDFNEAEMLEKQIKGWSRKKKEALMAGDWDRLRLLSECKNSSHHKNKKR